MKIRHKVMPTVVSVAILWCLTTACTIFNSVSWQEEVLLHDGSKIVVDRTTNRAGRHEVGQRPPIENQKLSFTLPSSQQTISWEVEHVKDIGRAGLSPIMLDIIDNTPFLVSRTVGCLAYNKWGRPNPPYIIFRYANNTWQQIDIKDLPLALKLPNMIISSPDVTAQRTEMKIVSADKIHKLNGRLSQPEFRKIIREPIPGQGASCGKMISDGNNGWIGIGWFTKQPSYEECLKMCEFNKMSDQYCPCKTIFNKNKNER